MEKYYLNGSLVTLIARHNDECWIKNQYGANLFININDMTVVNMVKVSEVPAGRRFKCYEDEYIKIDGKTWKGIRSDFDSKVNCETLCVVPKRNYRLYHFTSTPDTLVELLPENNSNVRYISF